ncbi:unnamed protein product [Orchesella dallaii]|uniref:Uncharacterized protein n=1 Tax=Orchesella dallaii TaxID=48710 RepID=A0ABP1RNQ4_9HEXA
MKVNDAVVVLWNSVSKQLTEPYAAYIKAIKAEDPECYSPAQYFCRKSDFDASPFKDAQMKWSYKRWQAEANMKKPPRNKKLPKIRLKRNIPASVNMNLKTASIGTQPGEENPMRTDQPPERSLKETLVNEVSSRILENDEDLLATINKFQ